ncbi:YhcB family protein [Halomonas sp. B23F22_10]|uniref:YhcB family protein n=1 Tax=Halomonas sp. B23F22_10 TaxID=3459515 RepID=UPI00373E30A3
MELSNINWMLGAACLLAGIGLGVLGYHLMNAGARNAQMLRQRLAERDRQLAELRDGVGEHFERLGSLAAALNKEVGEATSRLAVEAPHRPDLAAATATMPEPEEAATTSDDVAAPRDYADGNRGTLSEDFGLKQADGDAPQPPRY